MKLKITLGLFLATFLLSAQTARMNRDIEVAEKILETLVEEITVMPDENIRFFGNSKRVEGSYIEDFGVLFSISNKSLSSPVIWAGKDKLKIKKERGIIVIPKSNKVKPDDLEADKAKIQKMFRQVVETFICDYGYLMRQLKDNENIMIRYGARSIPRDSPFAMLALREKNQQNYSATISKTAIDDYQNKENKQQLIDRIVYVFEEAKDLKEKHKDLELLSTILKKLYKSNKEGSLYISATPYYEKIAGIGVLYYLDIRSGSGFNNIDFGQHSYTIWGEKLATVQEQKEATKEEVPINLDDEYAAFLPEFKNSIIDYGSIVKSLKDGETLTFKLRFPKCKTCEKMPKQLEIATKKSTLTAYRKETITLEAAIKQLTVKE